MSLRPSKRQSNAMIMETIPEETQIRPWADLPHDLLSPIADRLGIIELLSFRATCKDWHSSSSTASARIESSPNHKPWFLLHLEGKQRCTFQNVSENTRYIINIPEFEQSTCLASNQGWLLLSNNGSIYFFCPLSRAKIHLPDFPHSKLSDHVATISAPPTSKDCIICIINRADELKVELNFLKREDKIWETVYHECPQTRLNTITGATYQEGRFYFLDKDKKLLTYSTKKKNWVMYRIVESISPSPDTDCLPFLYEKKYFENNGYLNNWTTKGRNMSISTCGTVIEGGYGGWDTVINNEMIEADCKEGKAGKLKGVWIQPRFLQIPPNQSWSI